MSKPGKVPQDRQRKAAEQLRTEAAKMPGLEEMAGISLTVSGRNGEATVTTLDSPLDWDADCMGFLAAGDYLSAICGMISTEDGARLRAVRPSIGSLMSALMEPAEDDATGELSPGESQAS